MTGCKTVSSNQVVGVVCAQGKVDSPPGCYCDGTSLFRQTAINFTPYLVTNDATGVACIYDPGWNIAAATGVRVRFFGFSVVS